jgi:hypothetical protein
MDDRINVLREVIESPDDREIARDNHLEQILEPRSPFQEILGLGFGSRGYNDRDPAFSE